MNYTKIYDDFVSKRKANPSSTEYVERHHILPKCLGGGNSSDNIVVLTYREHFVCHWLLCKIYPTQHKLKAAFARMLYRDKQKLAGWQYDVVKRNVRNTHYDWLKGNTPWNKGKKGPPSWNKGLKFGPRTEAQKLQVSLKLKKRYETETHPRTGKPGWCAGLKGTGLVKAWNKGKTMPTKICLHCGIETSILNINRWHNDKCKHNKSV